MKANRQAFPLPKPLCSVAGVLLALFLPTSCVRLDPQTVTTTTYLLAMPQQGLSAAAGGLRQPTDVVGLQMHGLPAYADRFGLAVRNDRNEVHYAPAHRWGEPLRIAVPRFLRLAMEQRAPAMQVLPWPDRNAFADTAPVAVFAIEIEQLDAFEDGAVRLQARVRLQSGETAAVRVLSYHSTWQPGDYATLVSGHSTNINQLASDLLGWLDELGG